MSATMLLCPIRPTVLNGFDRQGSTNKNMALEIERKFLVRDETWRDTYTSKQDITDGLIAVADSRKVRVRICDQRATLAVKARTEGLANVEFEYEIPRAD